MEQLMEMAKRVSDQVELYALEEMGDGVSFENGKLKEIESQSQSGISLRVIRDGHLGFAYTKSLINREEFLQKFRECARFSAVPLDSQRVEKILANLQEIEKIPNLNQVGQLLA